MVRTAAIIARLRISKCFRSLYPADRFRTRAFARAASLALVMSAIPSAHAHGFGQRFDLPLPLWLWLTGAGATIVLTFVVMALFVKERAVDAQYPRLDLLQFRAVRLATDRTSVAIIRVLAVALFALTICAGLFGNQDPYSNLATTMIWVVWWVGLAFVCALIGDLWRVVNPLRIVFAWAEAAYAAATRGRMLSLRRCYPQVLGTWPAVLLFLGFAWGELIWANKDVPRQLGVALCAYAGFTWLGMLVFDREVWLTHGEAFSVAFGVLARFSPIEFVPPSADTPRPRLDLRPLGAT